MTTFKQFLSEQGADLTFKELIERDCKTFLDQAGGHLLWRGSKTIHRYDKFTTSDGFGVHKVPRRVQRKPRNTSPVSSEIMDDFFHDKFDWRPRSEGVFCQGDPKGTTFYGVPHCIFPIEEFKFVWSPKYEDLFGDISSTYTRIKDDLTPEELSLRKKQLLHYLEEGNYTDADLKAAIASKGGLSEIMINCKEYYAVAYEEAVAAFNLSDEL